MLITTAQVTNDFTAPVPVSPLGADSFYASRSGVMAPSGSNVETLYETVKSAVIEVLEVAGNQANAAQVRIWRRKSDGDHENLLLAKSDGSGPLPLTASEINKHGCAIFDIVTYDASTSSYKFVLNRPLAFPLGMRITIANATPSEKTIAASVYGRLLK